jgi:Zn-dependent M28 family amino/carboxypeptidase
VFPSQIREVFFCILCREEKGLLGSKHFEKLKQQNFNLYAQFNIEMIGVPMKRDYLAYLTGFEKSNMGEKLMNTPVKERWISA